MMILPLLTAALIASGPNFTVTVNDTDDKFVLNYVSHESDNVNSPLGVWFSFSGTPSGLSGELSHKSVSYSLFDNYNPTTSPVFIAPINAFFGEKISGNWQLKIESCDDFTIKQWGITTTTIPEPSIVSLLLIGSMLFFLKRK